MRSTALLLLSACAVEPNVENLRGVWSNTDADDGTIRTFEFGTSIAEWPEGVDATGDLFTITLATGGVDPQRVQAGGYSVDDGVEVATSDGAATRDHVLITVVRWSIDGSTTGATYGDAIDWMTADAFQICSSSSSNGVRVYRRDD